SGPSCWRNWPARSPRSTPAPRRGSMSRRSAGSTWSPATPGRTSRRPPGTSEPWSAGRCSTGCGRSPRRRWPATARASRPRAPRGVPRDTRGDLPRDRVSLFPERRPPADLVVIDCIEFNERFRFADPVADMAFLAMDLAFHGRRDLARAFADTYFEAAGDAERRALLPFYTAYR